MKTLIPTIVNAAKARAKKLLIPRPVNNPSRNFNPAPAYWVMAPVKPQDILNQRQCSHFNK